MQSIQDTQFRENYISNICKSLNTSLDKIEFIDVGTLNYVYKITTKSGIFYIKQGLESPKNEGKLFEDLTKITKNRMQIEKNALECLDGMFQQNIYIPKIKKVDTENKILILTDIGSEGINLREELINGNFSIRTAERIGKFLGVLHSKTWNNQKPLRNTSEDENKHWQSLLAIRSKNLISKDNSEEINNALEDIYKEGIKHTYNVLLHADLAPKNIIQHTNGDIGVFDFELSCTAGDPAHDVGFILGYYYLFSCVHGLTEETNQTINTIISTYKKEISHLNLSGIENRIKKYAGALLIYRASAPYISNEHNKKILELASKLLTTP